MKSLWFLVAIITLSVAIHAVSADVVCGTTNQYNCQNGGDCFSNACRCYGQWAGVNCTNVTSCNNANTFRYIPAQGCVCNSGWKGVNCTIPSTCNTVNTRYTINSTCICYNAWNGTNCTDCSWGVGCIAPQATNPQCKRCNAGNVPRPDLAPNAQEVNANTCNAATGACTCYSSPVQQATGRYCEQTYPCAEQSTMVAARTPYNCTCVDGYTGPTCEWKGYKTDTKCIGSTRFAGTCTFPSTSFIPYQVSLCSTTSELIASESNAQDYYIWSHQTNYANCSCNGNKYGPFCLCNSTTNPCQNGGSCNNITLGCQCPPQYQGYICNQTSSCNLTNTLYTANDMCVCKPGWTGATCTIKSCYGEVNGSCNAHGTCNVYNQGGINPPPPGTTPCYTLGASNCWTSSHDGHLVCGTKIGPPCTSDYYYQCDASGYDRPDLCSYTPGETGFCDFTQYTITCPKLHSCNCSAGYSGNSCEYSLDCDPTGTASISDHCECKVGWSGVKCSSGPCGNCGALPHTTGKCVQYQSGQSVCQVFVYDQVPRPSWTSLIVPGGVIYSPERPGSTSIRCTDSHYQTPEDCSWTDQGSVTCPDLFKCECAPGFGGLNCQVNLTDYCYSPGTIGYVDESCSCRGNYTGMNCSIDSCGIGSSCSGHGSCVLGGCQCDHGYSGALCDITPCGPLSTACGTSSHGYCDPGTAACVCNPQWTGSVCNISSGCGSIGTVSYNASTQTCDCADGYLPPYCCPGNLPYSPCAPGGNLRCETPVSSTMTIFADLATPSSCTTFGLLYSASLIYGINGSRLYCMPGYDPEEKCCPYGQQIGGTVCSAPIGCISQALGKTCVHGVCSGTCPVGSQCPANRCICDNGWGGSLCTQPLCHTVGSTSVYIPGSYVEDTSICDCVSGWSGPTCSCPPPFLAWGSNSSTSQVCGGYGGCVTTGGRALEACQCPIGYSGDYCCPDACMVHGACMLNNNSVPYCRCNGGWSGTYCNISVVVTSCGSDGLCNGNGICQEIAYADGIDNSLSYHGPTSALGPVMAYAFFGSPIGTEIYYGTSATASLAIDAVINHVSFKVIRRKFELLGYQAVVDWITTSLKRNSYQLWQVRKSDYINTIASLLYKPANATSIKLGATMFAMYGNDMGPLPGFNMPSPLPLTYPTQQCRCALSATGQYCEKSCQLSPLNNRPCTTLDYGVWHGTCPSNGAGCTCSSRYDTTGSCDYYRGEGCFPTIDENTACSGRGTCVYYSHGNSSCSCNTGTGGTHCEYFLCSVDDPSQQNIQCNNYGKCQANGICICDVAEQLAQSTPRLPVGNNCQYNAISQCGNFISATSIWRECNNRGTCINDTGHAAPYCQCQSGYTGSQCTQSLCSPDCNTHQSCNTGSGACVCLPKWSTASSCTAGNRTCECQVNTCVHGTPADITGDTCICDSGYRLDTNGLCTILQCPLVKMTDLGESTCPSGSCITTTASLSHSSGCCYDACKASDISGTTQCSLNATGSQVCACPNPSKGYNQVNGICYSKCNGQTTIPTSTSLGFQCQCMTSFFIQDPWNQATDFMDFFCLRKRCLNGGVVSPNGASCSCASGYTGEVCATVVVVSSSSSSTAYVSSSVVSSSSRSSSSGLVSSSSSSTGINTLSSTQQQSSSVASTSSSTSSGVSSTSSTLPSTTTGTSSGVTSSSSQPQLSSSGSSTASTNGTDSSSTLSTGAIAGIVVGSVVVSAIIGTAIYSWYVGGIALIAARAQGFTELEFVK